MSNTIDGLRASLFEAMRGLKDGTLDLDRARAIVDVGQAIINTAKVEVEYIKTRGDGVSTFLGDGQDKPGQLGVLPVTEPTANGTKTIQNINGVTITRHRMGH